MNFKDKQNWLICGYPLTIVLDRYGGTYSGAKYLAFPLDFDEIPVEVNGDDCECQYFWENYKEPVGKGATMNEALDNLINQMKESEDERIRQELIEFVKSRGGFKQEYLAWLEKQKKPFVSMNPAPEFDSGSVSVYHESEDERIRKALIQYLKDYPGNLPNGLYSRYDFFTYLEKQKEPLHVTETCKENPDSFTDAVKDVIVAIEKYLDWLTGYPDYAPKGKYSIRDMLHCLSILKKQKEQKDYRKLYEDIAKSEWFKKAYVGKSLGEDEQKEQKPVQHQVQVCEETELTDFENALFTAFSYAWQDYLSGKEVNVIEWVKEESPELLAVALQKQEWSEEEEQIFGNILNHYSLIEAPTDGNGISKERYLAFLNSLRPPFKDKEMKLKILKYLSTRCSSLEFEEVEDYLNNLRPSWKPSDEQLKALKYVAYHLMPDENYRDEMFMLYEQLKRLM